MENSEHNVVSVEADEGPFLFGVPSAGHRRLTNEERRDLCLDLIRRIVGLAALFLPVPILGLVGALADRRAGHDAVPSCVISALFNGFIILVSLATPENPIKRTLTTLRDYRGGIVERCDGRYSASKCSSGSITSMGDWELHYRLRVDLITEAGLSVVERLPHSGRLWIVNNVRVSRWLEIGWHGITQTARTTSDANTCDPNKWIFADDIGLGMPFFAIFVTVVVYNIWSPPWYELLLAFVSTMFVGHQTMCLYTAITATKRK